MLQKCNYHSILVQPYSKLTCAWDMGLLACNIQWAQLTCLNNFYKNFMTCFTVSSIFFLIKQNLLILIITEEFFLKNDIVLYNFTNKVLVSQQA